MSGSLGPQVGAASGSAAAWALMKPAKRRTFFSVSLEPCFSHSEVPDPGCSLHLLFVGVFLPCSFLLYEDSLNPPLYSRERICQPFPFFSSLWITHLIKEILFEMFQLLELDWDWCIPWYHTACAWTLQVPPCHVAPFWVLHFISEEWPCAYCIRHSLELRSLFQFPFRFSLPKKQLMWSRSVGCSVRVLQPNQGRHPTTWSYCIFPVAFQWGFSLSLNSADTCFLEELMCLYLTSWNCSLSSIGSIAAIDGIIQWPWFLLLGEIPENCFSNLLQRIFLMGTIRWQFVIAPSLQSGSGKQLGDSSSLKHNLYLDKCFVLLWDSGDWKTERKLIFKSKFFINFNQEVFYFGGGWKLESQESREACVDNCRTPARVKVR